MAGFATFLLVQLALELVFDADVLEMDESVLASGLVDSNELERWFCMEQDF